MPVDEVWTFTNTHDTITAVQGTDTANTSQNILAFPWLFCLHVRLSFGGKNTSHGTGPRCKCSTR